MSVIQPLVRAHQPPVKSVRVSQLGRIRDCEQVAAVCYRLRRGAIEFLLVQTRGSKRWTFPKGSAEPGLTHAQAAAIEAFEEAGVHGRIEEAALIRYTCRKPNDTRGSERSVAKVTVVSAHLCEVLRLCSPKESERNRTWFSVEEAKGRLREGRKKADGQEFARVVQRAVARITRLQSMKTMSLDQTLADALRADELQRVRFEAPVDGWRREASFVPYLRRQLLPAGHSHETMRCEVLPFGPSRPLKQLLSGAKKVKALGTGARNS